MHEAMLDVDLGEAGRARVFDAYSIDLGKETSVFYGSRSREPTGHPPCVALPQPTRCPIARLLSHMYVVNQYSSATTDARFLRFRLPEGHRIVEWDVPAGTKVLLSMGHLIGFSGSIRLSTIVSLQLTSMALGHMFFHMAEGPGKLLFECQGSPEVVSSAEEISSFSSMRLIACTHDSLFHLTGSKRVQDIYFSYLYLRAWQTRGIVIDADTGSSKRSGSLLRMLRRLYLPR